MGEFGDEKVTPRNDDHEILFLARIFFWHPALYSFSMFFRSAVFFWLWFEMGSPGTSRTLMSRIVTSSRNGVTWPTWRLYVGDSEMLDGFEVVFPCLTLSDT